MRNGIKQPEQLSCPKTGCPRDKLRYGKQNRNFKKLIKQCKQSFNKNLLENCRGDPKKTWKAINTLLGKTKTMHCIRLLVNDVMISDNDTIANSLNIYFNSVGETYGTKPLLNSFQAFLGEREMNSFVFYDITYDEIIQIIKTTF